MVKHPRNPPGPVGRIPGEDSFAACAPNESLDWEEGSYKIVRLSMPEFRDKPAAIAEVRRRFPGATIGKSQIVRGKWIVRIRPKES